MYPKFLQPLPLPKCASASVAAAASLMMVAGPMVSSKLFAIGEAFISVSVSWFTAYQTPACPHGR